MHMHMLCTCYARARDAAAERLALRLHTSALLQVPEPNEDAVHRDRVDQRFPLAPAVPVPTYTYMAKPNPNHNRDSNPNSSPSPSPDHNPVPNRRGAWRSVASCAREWSRS